MSETQKSTKKGKNEQNLQNSQKSGELQENAENLRTDLILQNPKDYTAILMRRTLGEKLQFADKFVDSSDVSDFHIMYIHVSIVSQNIASYEEYLSLKYIFLDIN